MGATGYALLDSGIDQYLPRSAERPPVIVHLLDGTFELFRHFYGARRWNKGKDAPLGAVRGVLGTVLRMFEDGATHLGVATDHMIESFRNALWPGYKTGAGIERALRAQFTPLEQALEAMGVAVWAMVELEADDGLAGVGRRVYRLQSHATAAGPCRRRHEGGPP